MRRAIFIVLAAAVPVSVSSQTSRFQLPVERDWSAALRLDAQALHDDVATNHPGPVNSEDPGFSRRNDVQLTRALARAKSAKTYEDYFFALREYVASFDDGHFGFGSWGSVATPSAHMAWPGFLTNYDGHGIQRVVVVRADDAPVPLGTQLIGCDGRSAKKIAAETLGAQWGRWKLQSQRENFGYLLFADWGDPYVRRPTRCDFLIEGHRRSVTLSWQSIGAKELSAQEKAARRSVSYSFAARTLADGTRWYSIPSFNADTKSTAGAALPGMIAGMREGRGALASAPAIVLDLRGNGGGSSDWSYQIANVLWGQKAVRRRPSTKMEVDWRVSSVNLKSLEDGYARQGGTDMSLDSRQWYESVMKGLRGALAGNAVLWRQNDDPASDAMPSTSPVPDTPLRVPVYFITDASCGSACLDAVDLWRAMGAIHVGRTTSADTLYMELRSFKLPSGLSGGGMPMKVYRGRPRGANVPVVPTYIFDGDITDTTALETWVAGLRSIKPKA